MQPDVLAQLRDIHLPAPPLWWPPAPGWWIAAAATLLAVALLGRYLLRYRQRGAPIRMSQRLLAELYQDYERGNRGPLSFVNACNELLKRLLIHALADADARPASGEAWLELLDHHSATNQFTQGPGRALGSERFRPDQNIDVPALHQVLTDFLRKVGA
jgi:hypothetical protein